VSGISTNAATAATHYGIGLTDYIVEGRADGCADWGR
jgi:hypothetical protein